MKPTTIPEIQEVIFSQPAVRVRGGGSKPNLNASKPGCAVVEMRGLTGMCEYQPDEFTFTAYAGTALQEVDQALAEHGQFMPFDPLLVEAGATLGGTVASGLSGPCRYRYGGVRDFILGVQFIDGRGNLVRGGGKVVKNAAGFDLPKLMVGALGMYGVLVELSFKVFPRPARYTTIKLSYPSLSEALHALARLSNCSLELFALDLEPKGAEVDLYTRLGGNPGAFTARTARLCSLSGGAPEILDEAADGALWHSRRELAWLPAGCAVVKAPLTPAQIPVLDARLGQSGAQRLYSVAGSAAWIGWPGALSDLDNLLVELGLPGLVITGGDGRVFLGVQAGQSFAKRVRRALDPAGKFALQGEGI